MSQTNISYILYSVVCFFNQMFGIFLMMMICVDNFLLIDASIKRLTDLEFSSFCKLQTLKNHENCLINCLILCLIIKDWIIHTAFLSFFIAKMCISAFTHPKYFIMKLTCVDSAQIKEFTWLASFSDEI